jgi:hypothetical protein
MKINREKIYNILLNDGRNLGSIKNYQLFEDSYFSSEKNVDVFWDWLSKNDFKKGPNKGQKYTDRTKESFYKKYVCDLDWAKSTQYCGGSTPALDNTSLIPDANTIKKIVEKGQEYTIGLKGNELMNKFSRGWDSAMSWGADVVKHLKKKYYDIDPGKGVFDTPENSSSSTDKWLKDPTNSKMYVYKVKNCKWLAKNVKTGKIFNISDDSRYKSSVDILNKEYSQYLKNCNPSNTDNTQTDNTQIDGTQTITPTPTPLPVNLPSWATCIGQSFKGAVVTMDENNHQIIMASFGKDVGYFWDDKTFMFTYTNGVKIGGTWSCEGNKLFIKTTDGEQWSIDTQWISQPSSSINPSVNYQTTGVDATTVMTNDASEPEKSDKSSSTQPQQLLQQPSEPISKPDDEKSDLIDKYGKQNESVYLEDVLNNVNTLINEIDMKSRIMEQSKPLVVVAPAQELDILYNHAILKNIGSIQTLCNGRNGTAIPVNINGRMYFAGRRGKLTPALGGGEGFITYDGKILKNTGGCNYTYVLKDGNIVTMDGIDQIELQLPQKQLLSRFGIDGVDYNSDPYSFIDNITTKFQSLIDKGARSKIFKNWSDLLKNYYKYGPQEKWLDIVTKPESGTNPPQDELGDYVVVSADKLGIQFNDRQIQIFVPRGVSTATSFKAAIFNSGDCKNDLTSYINGAFDFQQTGKNDPNINNSTVRTNIKSCFRAGEYKDIRLTSNDITVKFNDKDNPFKGLRGFGSEFDINEIQKLLMGGTFKLPNVGPNGKNPYLPFRIDARQGMTESKHKLSNLIKENLLNVSKQKNESLLIEKKIVQTRTKLISENRILKFKQPREKFFNEIISEAIYFEKQGFNKQIIKEEFWDSMKGLFGEHGSSAIFSTFKEYMGKHLVEKLTSINPNGWMGQNIKKAINTIHIEDIDKIVDCNFITKKVSSSISEAIINKISQGQDIEGGGIESIVKGGLDKSIDRTELNKNIHDGISKLICPVLGDVSKKLKEKGEEMKLKAVRP